MPAPADDLDDAMSQPVPDGASEQMRMLRRQGNRCRLTIRELSDAKVIPEFAMDQYGSRYLHTSLDSASDEVNRFRAEIGACRHSAGRMKKDIWHVENETTICR